MLSGYGVDTDFLAQLVFLLKLHKPVSQSEKSIIPAHPDIIPRMEVGPQLPHDYVTGAYKFTAEFLDAPSLPGAVATVPGASSRFLMCHAIPPENRNGVTSAVFSTCGKLRPKLPDIFNPHSGKALPMSLLFAVVLAPLVLEDDYF